MKIVLAFDSFKGSLSAFEAGAIAREVLEEKLPGCELAVKPMADGGEGTARAILASCGGEWRTESVTGPLPDMRIEAGYVLLPDRALAVVEMATASGLPLLAPEQRNPMRTTTYGTGQLIRAAIDAGATSIWLAVGGSATVDGGTGAAMALGWRFLDEQGRPVDGTGGSLSSIHTLHAPATTWPNVEVLSDVTHPLCGPSGAARIFGPQKGATPDMVETLEKGLIHLADLLDRRGIHIRDLPGAGAAGGLAGGAVAFMGAHIVPGIDRVMEIGGMEQALRSADWVITGEGAFDRPSLQGKVVSGVLKRARATETRVAVVAGDVRLSESEWRVAGVSAARSLRTEGMTVEESVRKADDLLRRRIEDLIPVLTGRSEGPSTQGDGRSP